MKKYLDEFNRPIGMSVRKKKSSFMFMLLNFEKRVFSEEPHSEILKSHEGKVIPVKKNIFLSVTFCAVTCSRSLNLCDEEIFG
jgi:hypothetical protein